MNLVCLGLNLVSYLNRLNHITRTEKIISQFKIYMPVFENLKIPSSSNNF